LNDADLSGTFTREGSSNKQKLEKLCPHRFLALQKKETRFSPTRLCPWRLEYREF